MATSSSASKKPIFKDSQILPSCYHLPNPLYAGCVRIGGDNYYTPWIDDKEEVMLDLRCLEKSLSFEVIDTVEGEGYFPERAKLMEEKYQASGRTNGLYTGLMTKDGAVSDDTTC